MAEHINLNNMFPTKIEAKTDSSFTIDSLFKSVKHPKNRHIPEKIHFDVGELRQERQDINNKIIFQYKKYFNTCLDKIKSINKLNKTMMYFEVPNSIHLYSSYDSLECLMYIQKKLLKLNVKSNIVSETKIVVDWTDE